jgi:S-formylglutathione hydrolase FrmB
MRRATLPAIFLLAAVLARPLHAGEARADEVDSKVLGKKLPLLVLLPDGYDTESTKRYPVVYLLHGVGGDYREWQRVGIEKEAAGLPVIIAMPEGDRSFYVNSHDAAVGRWEDYITGEVIAHVDAKYRTVAAREARGISGLSMGGYGAVTLGLRKPKLFATIASHSGALAAPSMERADAIGDRLREVFGPKDSPTRRDYDPILLLRSVPAAERPKIYVDCGGQDFLLESSRAFVRELAAAGADYEYREMPGKHDFAYWKANVRYSLSRQLEAMAQAAEAARKRPPSPETLAALTGAWKGRGTLPQGGERQSVIHLERKGDGLAGSFETEERKGDLSRVRVEGDVLVFEIDVERDGQKGMIRVDARLKDGKLAGTWSARMADGTELASGDWQAVKEAPAAARLDGSWKLVLNLGDQALDYTLRIRGEGEKLEGVLVSPRSGEHKFQTVTWKDGKLHMEIVRTYEGMEIKWKYDGELTGKGLSGKVVPEGFENELSGTWTAEKEGPGAAPEKL